MRTQKFAELVSKSPNNELFRFSLAQALLDEGRHDEAIEHLDLCLKKNPEWMMAEILRGKALAATGNFEAARISLQSALALAIQQRHEAPEAEIRKLLAGL